MIASGKTILAGVLGWPVGHSRSPRLHGYWLRQLGIDGSYIPLAVLPDDFAHVLRALPRMGFAGANVTVPHKESAMALVDHLEPLARRIGAVNTIICRPDGSIEGRNTDAFGFYQNLCDKAPHWHPSHGPATVLGAGGAARAVIAALLDAGVSDIRVVNRSLRRASEVGEDLQADLKIYDWDHTNAALDGSALLVNTTTLGMQGQPPLELDLSPLPLSAVVNDIVYVPLMTPLLQAAQQRGNALVDGIGMLLWQAVPGFQAWFGASPQVTAELRDFVLAA